MTASETIEWIKELKGSDEILEFYYAESFIKALDMAIWALEKQISKKPTPIDYEKYIDVIDNARFLRGAYWCPNCKHVVKSGSFCSDCGQKLDWENT